MANITITVGPKTFSETISTANLTRLATYASDAYKGYPDPAQQLLVDIWTQLKSQVYSYEINKQSVAIPQPASLDT